MPFSPVVNRPLSHAEEVSIGQNVSTSEIIRVHDLIQAMTEKRTVSFIYDRKNKTVEVHAVGTSGKDGSIVMRGFQVAGTSSRPLPMWSLFTVAKIEGLSLDFVDSQAPREGYTQGDKQMAKVVAELAL